MEDGKKEYIALGGKIEYFEKFIYTLNHKKNSLHLSPSPLSLKT
tara:strand:+ start:352 stop:483 length:132 start_codon:yes stop_codon:yes gene_type:complete